MPMRYPRIRELREDRDLTQKELADYLKCSQVSYSYYEIGARGIPTDVLVKIARYHCTSTDYLLGLTGQREPCPSPKHERRDFLP